MIKLFVFEWKKIIKNKTTWILLILSVLATIGIYFFHLNITNNVQNKAINKYDFLIDLYLQDAEDWALEKEKALISEDEELIEDATMMEESSRQTSALYRAMKESYLNGEWGEIYQEKLDILESFVYLPPGEAATYIFEDKEITDFTLRASYEKIKYMQENQIEPFIQNTVFDMLLPTVYEDFSGRALEKWKDSTSKYGKQGIYFLYQLIQLLYIPIIILLGCFIFGNTLSSDTKRKKNGIRFYQVLPLNQSRLFFAKYITGYLGIVIFVLIMIGIPLLVGSIMNGFGDLNYPILVYDGYTSGSMGSNAVEDTFHFIPLKEYLMQTLVFSIVMSLLVYSIYYLVSQFIKEPIFNVIMVGSLFFIGTLIPHSYNPFSYMDTDKVITHEIQLQTWNTDITYTSGLIVTLVIGLTFLALNYFSFKYRSTRG